MEKGALVLTLLWAPLVPHRFIVKFTFQTGVANRLGPRLNRASPATGVVSRAGDELSPRARPATNKPPPKASFNRAPGNRHRAVIVEAWRITRVAPWQSR
jgi:hypothetical protein